MPAAPIEAEPAETPAAELADDVEPPAIADDRGRRVDRAGRRADRATRPRPSARDRTHGRGDRARGRPDVVVDDAEPVIDLDALEPAAATTPPGATSSSSPSPMPSTTCCRPSSTGPGSSRWASKRSPPSSSSGPTSGAKRSPTCWPSWSVGPTTPRSTRPARASSCCSTTRCPSRPGQLTDFAKLNPADKKRIIIRVLCLLVARSEDQQLPPRATADSGATSWPLARAVWPASVADDEPEGVLPSRLAKSG